MFGKILALIDTLSKEKQIQNILKRGSIRVYNFLEILRLDVDIFMNLCKQSDSRDHL